MIGILLHFKIFKPLIRILSVPGIPNVWSNITSRCGSVRTILSSWCEGSKLSCNCIRKWKSCKRIRGVLCLFSGWWFQIYLTFTPVCGDDPIWREYFFQGGWNPPTSFFCWGRGGGDHAYGFSTCPANTISIRPFGQMCNKIVYIVNWLRYSYFFLEIYFASIYHRWLWLTWASGFDPFCFGVDMSIIWISSNQIRKQGQASGNSKLVLRMQVCLPRSPNVQFGEPFCYCILFFNRSWTCMDFTWHLLERGILDPSRSIQHVFLFQWMF